MKMNKSVTIRLTRVFLIFFLFISSFTFLVVAYFSQFDETDLSSAINVNDLFGKLDEPVDENAKWGSKDNPYLIYNNRHLSNLYVLQNGKDATAINENTYFQVSDANGKPCFVGGIDKLLDIPSIGTEDFPFVSTIYGVKSTDPNDYYTLPSGEKSDTSALGNIRVTAYEGQIDVGLFGVVGRYPKSDEEEDKFTGAIYNLLLNNIQIFNKNVGDSSKENHQDYFVSTIEHETNHIGILVGHAQYCQIYDISVYYSTQTVNGVPIADVSAFVLNDDNNASKYTTASGIIGFYKEVLITSNLDEDTINSDGLPNSSGGSNVGLGLGVVYSEDIWTFMEKNYFGGNTASENEYNLQEKFDFLLYGEGNTDKKYFQIGVFTFAHSTQMINKDRIAKLWKSDLDTTFTISTSNDYSAQGVVIGDIWQDGNYESKKYQATLLSGYSGYLSTTESANSTTSGFGLDNYRYMIVVTVGVQQYALIKYGTTATHVPIDINNLVIPNDQINNYTFRVSNTREANSNYPPYSDNAAYKYNQNVALFLGSYTGRTQFLIYGNNVLEEGSTTKYRESERPLRIYYSNNSGTTSFIAAASTSSTSYDEGVILLPENNVDGNNRFRFRRIMNGATANYYMSFNQSTGFAAVGAANSSVYASIYAVRITQDTIHTDHGGTSSNLRDESPITASYIKQNFTPGGTTKDYDMSKNVLFYKGTASSTNPNVKYQYDIVSLESLNWSDNKGEAITRADTVLKMADPTAYYYINSILRGVVTNIKAPAGISGNIHVPEASIGFTVQGTGTRNSTSKIFVIVATDPRQLVDQLITVSYFGTNASTGAVNSDRSVVESFALPAVPGDTVETTTPIYITDNGVTYTAYPNFSTLLVAYEFEVPSTDTRTYFLEASKGSANFVYLSVERTATTDSNPTHKNDIVFDSMEGIDFVSKINETVATVTSSIYIQSLVVPYFGISKNPLNKDGTVVGVDPFILKVAEDFTYTIGRVYDTVKKTHIIYIDIKVLNYQTTITKEQMKEIMLAMNFNFTGNSYLDMDNYSFVYSDVVEIRINNYLVDWTYVYQ